MPDDPTRERAGVVSWGFAPGLLGRWCCGGHRRGVGVRGLRPTITPPGGCRRFRPWVDGVPSRLASNGWPGRAVGFGATSVREWCQTPVAQRLRDDPELLAAAMRVDVLTDRARRSG